MTAAESRGMDSEVTKQNDTSMKEESKDIQSARNQEKGRAQKSDAADASWFRDVDDRHLSEKEIFTTGFGGAGLSEGVGLSAVGIPGCGRAVERTAQQQAMQATSQDIKEPQDTVRRMSESKMYDDEVMPSGCENTGIPGFMKNAEAVPGEGVAPTAGKARRLHKTWTIPGGEKAAYGAAATGTGAGAMETTGYSTDIRDKGVFGKDLYHQDVTDIHTKGPGIIHDEEHIITPRDKEYGKYAYSDRSTGRGSFDDTSYDIYGRTTGAAIGKQNAGKNVGGFGSGTSGKHAAEHAKDLGQQNIAQTEGSHTPSRHKPDTQDNTGYGKGDGATGFRARDDYGKGTIFGSSGAGWHDDGISQDRSAPTDTQQSPGWSGTTSGIATGAVAGTTGAGVKNTMGANKGTLGTNKGVTEAGKDMNVQNVPGGLDYGGNDMFGELHHGFAQEPGYVPHRQEVKAGPKPFIKGPAVASGLGAGAATATKGIQKRRVQNETGPETNSSGISNSSMQEMRGGSIPIGTYLGGPSIPIRANGAVWQSGQPSKHVDTRSKTSKAEPDWGTRQHIPGSAGFIGFNENANVPLKSKKEAESLVGKHQLSKQYLQKYPSSEHGHYGQQVEPMLKTGPEEAKPFVVQQEFQKKPQSMHPVSQQKPYSSATQGAAIGAAAGSTGTATLGQKEAPRVQHQAWREEKVVTEPRGNYHPREEQHQGQQISQQAPHSQQQEYAKDYSQEHRTLDPGYQQRTKKQGRSRGSREHEELSARRTKSIGSEHADVYASQVGNYPSLVDPNVSTYGAQTQAKPFTKEPLQSKLKGDYTLQGAESGGAYKTLGPGSNASGAGPTDTSAHDAAAYDYNKRLGETEAIPRQYANEEEPTTQEKKPGIINRIRRSISRS
ncbi:hypothetical protein KAFR_0F00300 [Kazachstania africana CBS 2517]|uniref:Uncharacterized protein n=1 Tax=Kazachstania africana (strain ATCC 22294 / BCRC 22015 / CBS 2517 / CECT 1963 / NBRC 1671 / NRRL Y-8276) TaxID=1071382 RepID=H2AW77_KAZAF|nr:hypothetical protein KAFR_0F00300 [Kazachstania africana CBS 2517]CCF58627.1 hypothetical protein KAFR_0F00300 [Kazachstania africana CBS 2517]